MEGLMFVDSHCHLNNPKLIEHIDDILARAHNRGVTSLLTIGTQLREVPTLQKIASHSNVYFSVGVHPHEVETQGIPSVGQLISLVGHPKAIGLGETGLDYYYEHSPRDPQKKSFRHHIEAAVSLDIPLIIHSREAEEDIIATLREFPLHTMTHPGVIHCFTGTAGFAQTVLDMGFFISISGIVTFKNTETLQTIVKTIPLNRLLIETDAPWLAPIPYRGKTNEPAFVVHTAEKIAELTNQSLVDTARITTNNFFDLFRKAHPQGSTS